MKILITNDDGINSEGIKILEKKLVSKGHDVWVCAPDSQRSACSHAVTLGKEIRIRKVSEKHYACEGFPADCILYPLSGALPIGKPDLVISGINEGFNLSTDQIYSGTVGGAREGALKGIVSIALSCETVITNPSDENLLPLERNFQTYPFEEAADFVNEIIPYVLKNCEKGRYCNINVPDGANGKWKNTITGTVTFDDVAVLTGEDNFRIKNSSFPVFESEDEENSDYYTVFVKRMIAVTMMKVAP